MKKLLTFALFAACGYLVVARLLPSGEEPSVGAAAPEIVGKDLDGVAFKLSDYRGKVVVLDFWGFW